MGLFDSPIVKQIESTVSAAAVKTNAQLNGVIAKTSSELNGAVTSTKTQLDDLKGGRSYQELVSMGANKLINDTVNSISNRVESTIDNVGNKIQSSIRTVANTISGIIGRLKNYLFGSPNNDLVNIDGSIMGISSSYQSVNNILNIYLFELETYYLNIYPHRSFCKIPLKDLLRVLLHPRVYNHEYLFPSLELIPFYNLFL